MGRIYKVRNFKDFISVENVPYYEVKAQAVQAAIDGGLELSQAIFLVDAWEFYDDGLRDAEFYKEDAKICKRAGADVSEHLLDSFTQLENIRRNNFIKGNQ